MLSNPRSWRLFYYLLCGRHFISTLYVLIEFSHTSLEIGTIIILLWHIRKQKGREVLWLCLRSCGQEITASVGDPGSLSPQPRLFHTGLFCRLDSDECKRLCKLLVIGLCVLWKALWKTAHSYTYVYGWIRWQIFQDCCQRNGADISFLKSVCTFKTAKIHLTPLNK